MPKGIYERTDEHKIKSRINGQKRLGKLPVNAKYIPGFIKGDFQIIERLTPVGERQNNKIIFQCKCLECDELREISDVNFKQNDKLQCSKKYRPSNWTGHELISGSYWHRVQSQAASRNIEFDYTIEDAWGLYEIQNKKCAYSGVNITFSKQKSGNTASFDRIDNSKGYIKGNVQWVHKDVNMMKRNLSEEYFLQICENIVRKKSSLDN